MSWSRHRLNSARWHRVRRVVLDRDSWRCVQCGRAGMLQVDHVKPLSQGGEPWDEKNLQSLCKKCHWTKTGLENGRRDGRESARWRDMVATMLK